jgi:hypothetical protein
VQRVVRSVAMTGVGVTSVAMTCMAMTSVTTVASMRAVP